MMQIKKNFVAVMFAILIVSVYTAGGQSLIEQIGWKGADTSIITGIFLIILTAVAILILIHLQALSRKRHEMVKLAYDTFRKNVESAELTETEASKIKTLLRHANTAHPHIIFQSASLFERCIDAEVSYLLRQNTSQDIVDLEEEMLGVIRKKLGYGFLPYEHPLISTRNLEIGQKLAIIDRRSKTPLIQNARVVQNKEFCFKIQYNPENEENLGVLEGQSVMLALARQSDGVYGAQVVICGKDRSTVDVRHTMELTRNQLRQYARVDINIPVKLRLIKSANNENMVNTGSLIEGRMLDISGGGGCIIIDKSLIPGDIVSMNFRITENVLNGVAARILRVSLQEIHDATFYRHSLQYVNIEQTLREKIIRFVFEKQRQVNQWR